jgi:hypothetical protein
MEDQMDPITSALVGALANLGVAAIKDSYAALKAALQQKFGVDSDLIETIDALESKPESEKRQNKVQTQVEAVKAYEDLTIHHLAEALLEKLNTLSESTGSVNVEISGGTQQGVIGAGHVEVGTMSFGNPPNKNK